MYRTNGINPSSSRPLPGLGALVAAAAVGHRLLLVLQAADFAHVHAAQFAQLHIPPTVMLRASPPSKHLISLEGCCIGPHTVQGRFQSLLGVSHDGKLLLEQVSLVMAGVSENTDVG